jgi:hypothetical protein
MLDRTGIINYNLKNINMVMNYHVTIGKQNTQ